MTGKIKDLFALALGFLGPVLVAAAVLILQGAGPDAVEDVFRYGSALATLKVPDPAAPSKLVRWIAGNSDLGGRLPWPFGKTNYLVWWGCGSWPIWLASVPALAVLSFGAKADRSRRLVAGLDALRLDPGGDARLILAALLPPAHARPGDRPGPGPVGVAGPGHHAASDLRAGDIRGRLPH